MKKVNYRLFLVTLFLLLLINLSSWAIDFFELCEAGTPEEIQKAIQAGANVNDVDENGRTPIMFATMQNPDPEVIRILLQAGADVNKQDKYGLNSLIYAAMHPNPEVVKILLQAGADVDSQDLTGGTSLDLAVAANPNPEVIKTLLQAGADVNSISNNGRTPLIFAAFNNASPEVVKILLQAGADPFITDNKGKKAIDYAQKGTTNYKLLAQATSTEESEKGVQPTSGGEIVIKYDGEIQGLAGLQLEIKPYQNVNRFSEFNYAIMKAGIDTHFLSNYSAEQKSFGTKFELISYMTSHEPDDFLSQLFEKETRKVTMIWWRLQLFWDIRDKYGSLEEAITALINGINVACGISLEKDIDYNIVKQIIQEGKILVMAGRNYEIRYAYLHLLIETNKDISERLLFNHHLLVTLIPSRYYSPSSANSQMGGSGTSYKCSGCWGGHISYFSNFNVIDYNDSSYVKIWPKNNEKLPDNIAIILKGKKWIPEKACWDDSIKTITEYNNLANGYEITKSNNQIQIKLFKDYYSAFNAIPWKEVKLYIYKVPSGELLGSYVFKGKGGIIPRIQSHFGQCVWWACKRKWETDKKIPPFYPSIGENGTEKINPAYIPKAHDVLIHYDDQNNPDQLGHYAFIENVEDNGNVTYNIKISQYNVKHESYNEISISNWKQGQPINYEYGKFHSFYK